MNIHNYDQAFTNKQNGVNGYHENYHTDAPNFNGLD